MHTFSDSYSFKVVNCQYSKFERHYYNAGHKFYTQLFRKVDMSIFNEWSLIFFFSDEIGSAYTSEVTTLFTSYNGLFFIGAKYFVTILNFNSFHSITRRRHQLSIQINMKNISFYAMGCLILYFFLIIQYTFEQYMKI